MIEYEDNCCGCPKEMGCLGETCPKRHEAVLTCDKCGEQVEKLYDYDGEQLCAECILDIVGATEITI